MTERWYPGQMGAHVHRAAGLPVEAELALRALDALDGAVIVYSSDLRAVLHANAVARSLLADAQLAESIVTAAEGFIGARHDASRPPPAVRIEHGPRGFYVRAVPSAGTPPAEIVLVREEVLRDVDVFKTLNAQYRITRREFQILSSLRLGKTNRQIAGDLGLAEGTVARHVHRMLERFGAPNRTRLVDLVDRLIARRG